MREKPLILIVDDEPDIREVVRIKLEASGFAVEEASNGQEGIDKARRLKPEILLLDVVMPQMDGVEALLKLKEDADTRKIKIFLFTGKGDPWRNAIEVNRRFAIESGAVNFIRKEIDLNDLVEEFRKTCERIKKEEESEGIKK